MKPLTANTQFWIELIESVVEERGKPEKHPVKYVML
jgi:hypothetical protein